MAARRMPSFTPADREHASYLFRNRRTLLTGDGTDPLAPARGPNAQAPAGVPERRRFTGPLDIRAAEDDVSTDQDSQDEAVRSPAVDSAIMAWNNAKRDGDHEGLSWAARALVDATAGLHRMRGVPLFAHPVVPPQFVKAEADEIGAYPAEHHTAMLRSLIDKFDRSAKHGIAQQFAAEHPFGANRRSDGLTYDPSRPPQRQTLEMRDGPPRLEPLSASRTDAQPGTPRESRQASDRQPPGVSQNADRSSDASARAQERKAVFAGGKVVKGLNGSTRAYRLGDRAFQVPSGQDEGDIVDGINYLANRGGPTGAAPASFANDPNGNGVIALDVYGRPMSRHNRPVKYGWEKVRQLGALTRVGQDKNWPTTPTGMEIRWDDKPTEAQNLIPFWPAAQAKYRYGDKLDPMDIVGPPFWRFNKPVNAADATVDPVDWELDKDSETFANVAQSAARGEGKYRRTLPEAIARARETGEPQPIDIFLPSEGTPYTARGQVLGFYGMRVRGMLVVKGGRYYIVGRGTVEDGGKFNYDLDNWDQRSERGKALLIAAHGIPDPTAGVSLTKSIAYPGHSYTIRANREANVRLWGAIK